MQLTTSHPISANDRLETLDVIRGVAVLGILIMNIQSFAMVQAAYANPMAYGDLTGINFWIYYLSHLFADQKFMTIFSMLFGAGIVLMATNIERRGEDAKNIHRRRMIILAAVGLLHSLLLWWGDILFTYAICGLIAYGGRHKTPKQLFIRAFVLIAICSLLMLGIGAAISTMSAEEMTDFMMLWAPSPEEIQAETQNIQMGWIEQFPHRIALSLEMMEGIIIYIFRVVGLMYLGMALFKCQFFTKQISALFLGITGLIAFAFGLTMTVYGNALNFDNQWQIDGMFTLSQFNYWASILMAYAYMCILNVLCRSAKGASVKKALANVGKMALTNYLSQTIICSVVFYGWGLGLFGELARAQQFMVVMAVWASLITFSWFWMSKFRFGPFEWLWRSLTYRQKQSLKLAYVK